MSQTYIKFKKPLINNLPKLKGIADYYFLFKKSSIFMDLGKYDLWCVSYFDEVIDENEKVLAALTYEHT